MQNGGINPRDVVMRHAIGLADPLDPVLWLCTMCQSCTERCQLDVGPSDLIKELRSIGAEKGNCPKAFSEEAKLFLRTGLSFPNTGLTKKIRKEMGLPDIPSDPQTLNDIQFIAKRSRLGVLKFE